MLISFHKYPFPTDPYFVYLECAGLFGRELELHVTHTQCILGISNTPSEQATFVIKVCEYAQRL